MSALQILRRVGFSHIFIQVISLRKGDAVEPISKSFRKSISRKITHPQS